MQWQSSRKMSRPETSRIGFLGVLCSTEFSVHFFWKLIENVEDTKKNSVRLLQFLKSISEVFQSMWSWDLRLVLLAVAGSRSSSEAATPLGRHGTYDEVRDFDLCQTKTRKNIKKNMGLLGFSRFIPLFIQILWFLGRKSGFFGGGGFDRSCGQPPRRISKFSASDKLGKLRVTLLFFAITIEQWLVDLGVSFYNVLSRKLHWSHFSWCLISHEFRVSHQRLKVYIETHVGRSDQLYPRPFQVEGSVIIRRGRNLKKCRKKT